MIHISKCKCHNKNLAEDLASCSLLFEENLSWHVVCLPTFLVGLQICNMKGIPGDKGLCAVLCIFLPQNSSFTKSFKN